MGSNPTGDAIQARSTPVAAAHRRGETNRNGSKDPLLRRKEAAITAYLDPPLSPAADTDGGRADLEHLLRSYTFCGRAEGKSPRTIDIGITSVLDRYGGSIYRFPSWSSWDFSVRRW